MFFLFGVPVLVLVSAGLGCGLNLKQRTNHPSFFFWELEKKALAKGYKFKPTTAHVTLLVFYAAEPSIPNRQIVSEDAALGAAMLSYGV